MLETKLTFMGCFYVYIYITRSINSDGALFKMEMKAIKLLRKALVQ